MVKDRILITGVTGFIGSHLAQTLKKIGYETYGLTKASSSRNNAELAPFLHGVKVVTCDISDYHSLHNLIREINPDIIVHLAAASSIKDSFEKPFLDANTNIIGTMNIAHSILELPDHKGKRLIYASSAASYGIQEEMPIKEETIQKPLNPYAINKAMGETYLNTMGRVYGLKVVSMRPANTFGRKLDSSFFIESFITGMLKKEKLYLATPETVRDFVYVTDHVNAYVKAIEHPDVNGEVFNIGLGNGTTNKEIAFKLAKLTGYDTGNMVLGQYPPGYPFRPFDADQKKLILDNSKISKMLGWKSEVSLDEGLEKTVEFWRKKIGSN